MHTRYASLVKKMLTELLACEVDLLLKKDIHVHDDMYAILTILVLFSQYNRYFLSNVVS
jgi:predicted nucleotidyltransferase